MLGKADWGKILSKKPVKKTVAIHPIMDYYIRTTQSILTQAMADRGENIEISYSTALNFMLLWLTLGVSKRDPHDPEVIANINDFLRDSSTINELNWAEIEEKIKRQIAEKMIKRTKKI